MRPVQCKVCELIKGETNHWKLVWSGMLDGIPTFAIAEWDDDAAEDEKVCFVCGEQHALILCERWLSTKSLDAPAKVSGPIEPNQGEQHGSSSPQI